MRKLIVLVMIVALALIAVPIAQAIESIDFSNVVGASMKIDPTNPSGGGIGTFYFVPGNGLSADFQITGSTLGTADGDLGYITSPVGGFVIDGPILPESGAQYSSVSGTGSLKIIDKSSGVFMATLEWIKIETNSAGTIGNLNDQVLANISNITYSGSEADLVILASILADGGLLSFHTGGSFGNPITLTDLTTGTAIKTSSYEGSIAVPVPPAVLLFGTGLIGLVGLRFRRNRP